MTPEENPYGTDAHPEVTEISDLAENLLPVTRAQEVRGHLADCSLCADVRDSLEEIRGTLGTLPGAARMPADVAGRIDAALAAEALLDAHRSAPVSRETSPTDAAPVSRETGAAPSTHAPRTTTDRPAGPGGRGASRPGAKTGSGPGRRNSRRNRRLRSLLTTVGALAALGLGGALLQGLGGGSPDSAADGSAVQEQHADSGDGGGPAAEHLARRVEALLDQRPGTKKATPGFTSEPGKPHDPAPLIDGSTTVPPCVRAGIDRPERPLAAEPGRPYAGRPSYLVILPHPGDPDRVDAYVVDSSCTTDKESAPGEVLEKRTYPRD